MKIDLSTIALILSLVVPGLVAKRSQRRLSSQSFEPTGPTTELGELVALSLLVHFLLLMLLAIFGIGIGLLQSHSILASLRISDSFDYRSWGALHRSEVIILSAFYICLSVAIAKLVGICIGWSELNHPILRSIESSPALTRLVKRLRFFSLIEERPLSFELFTGESVARKSSLIFFLELRLRDDKGFITGELVKYAIVKDEEPHRPVVLRDVLFKTHAADAYQPMDGDRVLIDLADALFVQVSYRERERVVADMDDEDDFGGYTS